MNKKRLLKLADLLEADAKNKQGIKFDLNDWGYADDPDNLVSCGTVACAMGLAVASGAFKRAGLSTFGTDSRYLIPEHKGQFGFEAAESLFGIDSEAAHFLFDQFCYPNEKRKSAVGERYVAKRIRDFVAGKVAP